MCWDCANRTEYGMVEVADGVKTCHEHVRLPFGTCAYFLGFSACRVDSCPHVCILASRRIQGPQSLAGIFETASSAVALARSALWTRSGNSRNAHDQLAVHVYHHSPSTPIACLPSWLTAQLDQRTSRRSWSVYLMLDGIHPYKLQNCRAYTH
eukprot:6195051-Pleurochrysis_carterae.AAC.5